jgi:hypothetical protein
VLNLVYNPQGPVLPPPQAAWRPTTSASSLPLRHPLHRLRAANMPIQRFGSTLVSKGSSTAYMQLLKDHYSADNLDTVMCRSLVSVDWQGDVHDCDFNQMLKPAACAQRGVMVIVADGGSRDGTAALAAPWADR